MIWMKVVVVTHPYSHRKDLQNYVQVILYLIFSIAHYFVSILIVHIFVDVGWEQVR